MILRGRGGTGQTVALLQLAHKAYEDYGARTLILTYNLALVADMRRILALMRVPASVSAGGVRIESVMAYVGRLLASFGVISQEDDFLAQYSEMCISLADDLQSGAIPAAEILDLIKHADDKFEFDFVMVDEGQDWPLHEIQILRACYSQSSFVIADGIDQLVRGARAAWTLGVPPHLQSIFPLKSSLRMKRNIAIFSNALAAAIGFEDWHVEPNAEMVGGRVIVLQQSIENYPQVVRELIDEAIASGNEMVDLLFCVSSSWATADANGKSGKATAMLDACGVKVWDGTNRNARRDYPRSLDEARMFHFESCRGLEGWTVFCIGTGEFLNTHFQLKLSEKTDVDAEMSGATNAALEAMASWALIACTRAIDTLVIEGANGFPVFNDALKQVSVAYPDIVQWQ